MKFLKSVRAVFRKSQELAKTTTQKMLILSGFFTSEGAEAFTDEHKLAQPPPVAKFAKSAHSHTKKHPDFVCDLTCLVQRLLSGSDFLGGHFA